MLIAELFVITPNWKQPKYPSKGEQVNCGTSIMWNGLLIHANTLGKSPKKYSQ